MNVVDGPYYEELPVGRTLGGTPALTLDSGTAAGHRAIVGDRLALFLDRKLAASVTGACDLVHPGLAWDISIGQSSIATRQVLANLFYRGLRVTRLPALGDTLRTTTSVVGRRRLAVRADRPPRGLVVLRIQTVDADGRSILDYHRCAMVVARDAAPADAPEGVWPGEEEEPALTVPDLVTRWGFGSPELERIRSTDTTATPGERRDLAAGDVVSSAPELARLTLNIAAVHHDAGVAGGSRLVYGGHTIGIALAQAARAFPRLLTVTAWSSCDHTGPVSEGDTLHSSFEILEAIPVGADGGSVARIRCTTTAAGRDVLDWRFEAVLA